MDKNKKINIVYFSSPSGMTKKFVEKLGFVNYRIPLYAKDPELIIDDYHILATPTLGGGNAENKKNAVPKQIIRFLNNENNRKYCIGVIASGNTNFGASFVIGGKIVANKLQVPLLGTFELSGLPGEDAKIKKIIEENWEKLIKMQKEKKERKKKN